MIQVDYDLLAIYLFIYCGSSLQCNLSMGMRLMHPAFSFRAPCSLRWPLGMSAMKSLVFRPR